MDMRTPDYQLRRSEIETYFDRTAAEVAKQSKALHALGEHLGGRLDQVFTALASPPAHQPPAYEPRRTRATSRRKDT